MHKAYAFSLEKLNKPLAESEVLQRCDPGAGRVLRARIDEVLKEEAALVLRSPRSQ